MGKLNANGHSLPVIISLVIVRSPRKTFRYFHELGGSLQKKNCISTKETQIILLSE